MLLSHHPPSQYNRTYKILGIRICARCSGLPLGVILYMLIPHLPEFGLLLLFPLPSFANFLWQELGKMPSLNLLKTLLTLPLGYFLGRLGGYVCSADYLMAILLMLYLLAIQFLVAFVLHRYAKLEALVVAYEEGMYE